MTMNNLPHCMCFVGVYFMSPLDYPHKEPIWSMDSPHQGPVMRSFDVFFVVSLNIFLNHPSFRWIETQQRSFDFIVMYAINPSCTGQPKLITLSEPITRLLTALFPAFPRHQKLWYWYPNMGSYLLWMWIPIISVRHRLLVLNIEDSNLL